MLLDFGSYPRSVFGFVAHWVMPRILPVAFIAWVTARVRIRTPPVRLIAAWPAP
ncbi:MAG TPA: hypothetical protein VIJ07_11900 [Dermatophilaceae bacterium]